jgi:hypothetical protein
VKKTMLAALAALVTLAYAADSRMKPGLWEMRIIKNVVDGRDMAALMAAKNAQMQQAMANLPPDQLARMQAALKMSAGANGATRICISPDMAKRATPMVDQSGSCQPATVNRNGDTTSFEFNCTINGAASAGKGESTISGDVITTRTDITTHASNGATHVVQNESEMRYIGPDCGDVKPLSAPANH